MSKKTHPEGSRYNFLTALSDTGKRKDGHRIFSFRCDCGKIVQTKLILVVSGNTKSCGCWKKMATQFSNQINKTKHGLSKTRGYHVWLEMMKRCYNKKNKRYHKYGGRGILVSKRWHKLENFILDMGQPPEGLSIDRINNNKGYSKSNCRWATNIEQSNNKSGTIFVKYRKQRIPLAEVARKIGIDYHYIYNRLKNNISIEEIIDSYDS